MTVIPTHLKVEHSGDVEQRKEGNVLFNDALNTFYLQLYGIRHMVKDHSDSEKGNPLPPHGLLFPINSKVFFICTIHRQDSTYHGLCYTSRGALGGMRRCGARCSSVVRAFAHGAMGHRINPSWSGPIELFLVPTSAPQLV